MSDKPILFSPPMVRALLAGTKTQTRRAFKWQGPKDYPHSFAHAKVDNPAGVQRLLVPYYHPDDLPVGESDWGEDGYHRHYGRFEPGDRLWVKETHRITSWSDDGDVWVTYAADDAKSRSLSPDSEDFLERVCARVEKAGAELNAEGWYENIPPSALVRPSIFMPRWASRLTLTVTDVRVQRLQDLSEEDALAEGIQQTLAGHGRLHAFCAPEPFNERTWDTAREAYAELWRRINGPEAWRGNPWVAAYTFTVERRNIDARAAA
ncbi:hypothetical protein PRN20_18070 [Devosia sp. ZB163]|uniref:hypothetical protein n=1 Tax=Devosia sp. ZB163 TaxID=3025938 RepID=UPI00235F90EF|nr:hypothetical protein [Devosia sp. ZB163]MDC9825644.1 hypothetical protein [Devosia sp. ZB163]